MKLLFSLAIPLLLLIAVILGCSLDNQNSNTASIPSNATSSPANSDPPSNKTTSSASQSFAVNNVCSLPKEVAPITPFASLGGGTWGKWHDDGGNLDYGCNGGKGMIKLLASDNGDIIAEYGAIGGKDVVHQVSAEYMAMQYTGLTASEKKFRQDYANFCDKLSVKFFGTKLPEKFRKRLLDEATYSPSGTANEFAEKVGSGYVNLSSNKNKNVMVLLDVHYFSSEAEYKQYKDS